MRERERKREKERERERETERREGEAFFFLPYPYFFCIFESDRLKHLRLSIYQTLKGGKKLFLPEKRRA